MKKEGREQDESTNHKDASYFILWRIGPDSWTHVNWTTWHDGRLTLGLGRWCAEGVNARANGRKTAVGKKNFMEK